MPRGRAGMRRGMAEALERISERLPAVVIDTLREQWARVSHLDEEIGEIERRIALWHRGNADSQRVAKIPGVGVLTATAVVAAMGDPAAFRSGREFAAWLGLVPRHEGTGGRVRMLGISKRGGQISADPPDPRRPRPAHHKQGAARMGGAPRRAATAQRGHGRAGQQDGAHDLGLAGPRPGVPRGLHQPTGIAAADDGRNDEPNQEVVAERLRKARQGVMANRSDRDPPSLDCR